MQLENIGSSHSATQTALSNSALAVNSKKEANHQYGVLSLEA
jgi:hypothetical protein